MPKSDKKTDQFAYRIRNQKRVIAAVTIRAVFTCAVFLFVAFPAFGAQIDGVRMWAGPESTRLVFDLSKSIEHKVFQLANPHRIVVDFKNTSLLKQLPMLDFTQTAIKRIRSAPRNGHDLRVVLDLKSSVAPKSFLLRPTGDYGHRLVVDLEQSSTQSSLEAAKKIMASPSNKPRPIIVAVDAGHGGEDPGAIGKHGTHEKDVVLSISQKFAALLEAEPGLKPVMIRTGDYYISLRGRIRKARAEKADLFVSIHADAAKNRRARGASVFVLSQRGASSEAARWLAATQNNADLIGGVSLEDKDDLLASVLLDLSQNASIAASTEVGSSVLHELSRLGRVHKSYIERAGFVVLKSPDVPSILVETGFISNTTEERNLRSKRFQRNIAKALLRGVKRYFQLNPPAGTLYAAAPRRHVIRVGETISAIADKYNISLSLLREVNGLHNDIVVPGQVLRIPTTLNNS
jgi:N-acetylmuramoyl-L-alanine amidase